MAKNKPDARTGQKPDAKKLPLLSKTAMAAMLALGASGQVAAADETARPKDDIDWGGTTEIRGRILMGVGTGLAGGTLVGLFLAIAMMKSAKKRHEQGGKGGARSKQNAQAILDETNAYLATLNLSGLGASKYDFNESGMRARLAEAIALAVNMTDSQIWEGAVEGGHQEYFRSIPHLQNLVIEGTLNGCHVDTFRTQDGEPDGTGSKIDGDNFIGKSFRFSRLDGNPVGGAKGRVQLRLPIMEVASKLSYAEFVKLAQNGNALRHAVSSAPETVLRFDYDGVTILRRTEDYGTPGWQPPENPENQLRKWNETYGVPVTKAGRKSEKAA